MINEPALRDALVSLADQCKFQYAAMSAVASEVAALRETLRQIHGKQFSDVFEKQQVLEMAKTAKDESAATELLRMIVQRLKDGEVC